MAAKHTATTVARLPVDAEKDVGETRSRRAHVLLQDP